ncbi:MAG TPA: LuxR C-terminal-related transcriptional regulator [Ktedonobacteraceae bacterium]|nr:LuxR C-terminal-related transcriptional regulator [Ktedonobacteraceae bacterium]
MITDHPPLQAVVSGHSPGSAKRNAYHTPFPLTPLIGREREVQGALSMLGTPEVRLLTITGPGGVGKSRLALEVARDAQRNFSAGFCYVELAYFTTPEQVALNIARALGLRIRGHELTARLQKFLREKHLLLLLDNFDQVPAAAPLLSELLSACFQLKILVSSRAVLHMQGEFEFPVPPLSVPDLLHLPSPEALIQYSAVALFVQRAQTISRDFRITEENASAVAGICVRLDGLPLALELAVAHTKLLSPDQLLIHLKKPLDMLTRGGPDLPSRHQSLRDTIAWSYELLTTEEQRVFRQLSIFVGGCTLEAAEAVCAAPGEGSTPFIEVIESLLNKSLLYQEKRKRASALRAESRLLMLTTIREYGLERLTASGEIEKARLAHAIYYRVLAEMAEPMLSQGTWLEQLEQEHDNLSAALRWLLERKALEEALRLLGALRQFWFWRACLNEGHHFLNDAFTLMREGNITISPQVKAKVFYAAGSLAYWQADVEQARTFAEEGLLRSRQQGDTRGTALILRLLGIIEDNHGTDSTAADAFFKESLQLFKEAGDAGGTAILQLTLSAQAFFQGAFARVWELCTKSLVTFRALGDAWHTAIALHLLGWASYCQKAYATARRLSEESIALFRTLGNPGGAVEAMDILAYEMAALGEENAAASLLEEALVLAQQGEIREDVARTLCASGYLALRQGDIEQARAFYKQCLAGLMELWTSARLTIKTKWIPACCLEGLGQIALRQGQTAWTVRLFAAAETLRINGTYLNPIGIEQPHYDDTLTTARSQFSEEAFAALWAEGRAMTPEEALAIASNEQVGASPPAERANTSFVSSPGILTTRQSEVLRLLAAGLTNRQIADRLVISPRTVNIHVNSIYKKLEITSRAAATRYAIEQGLD